MPVRRPENHDVPGHLLHDDLLSVSAVKRHLAGQHVMQNASCKRTVHHGSLLVLRWLTGGTVKSQRYKSTFWTPFFILFDSTYISR